jgi:hypothetical protein
MLRKGSTIALRLCAIHRICFDEHVPVSMAKSYWHPDILFKVVEDTTVAVSSPDEHKILQSPDCFPQLILFMP